MEEKIWICEVCESGVASGGDTVLRDICPRCNSPQTSTCVVLPSRWKCESCGVASRSFQDSCGECGNRRCLHSVDTIVTCPTCFAVTTLRENERCDTCRASLSMLVNHLGSQLSTANSITQGLGSLATISQPGSGKSNGQVDNKTVTQWEDHPGQSPGSVDSSPGVPHQADSNIQTSPGDVEMDDEDVETDSTCGNVEDNDDEDKDGDHHPHDATDVELDAIHIDDSDRLLNMKVPSWVCSMCETENLAEEPNCAECRMAKPDGPESHIVL